MKGPLSMSKPISISLNQLFKKHQVQNLKSKGSIQPLDPVYVAGLDPVIYINGVSIIRSENRKDAAHLANFLASEFVKDKKGKVLHVSLEEFGADTAQNFLSLLGGEKVRHLMSPTFRLQKVTEAIQQYADLIQFVSLQNDISLMTQVMNGVEDLIKSGDFNLVVFEGVDKILSVSQRGHVLKQFTELLLSLSQESGIAVLCSFKEEKGVLSKVADLFVDKSNHSGKIKNFLLTSYGTTLVLKGEDEGEEIMTKNPEYQTFAPEYKFNEKNIAEIEKSKNLLFAGLDLKTKKPIMIDPAANPGFLFAGSMGSGKSIAMQTSIALHVRKNSENTIYLLHDCNGMGMEDETHLLPLASNVAGSRYDNSRIKTLISMLHEELTARKDVFKKENASSLKKLNQIRFEREQTKPLAQMMVLLEEFHALTNSPYLRYSANENVEGSTANLMRDLFKEGHLYGIYFIATTQIARTEDIPMSLKEGLTQAFVLSSPYPSSVPKNTWSAYDNVINSLPLSKQTRFSAGTSFNEGVHFPMMGKDELEEIVSGAVPLKAATLVHTVEDYQKKLN